MTARDDLWTQATPEDGARLEAIPLACQVLGLEVPEDLPMAPAVGQVLDVAVVDPEE